MQLSLIGPVSSLGYGTTTTGILGGLTKLGHDVSLVPIGPCTPEPADRALVEKCLIGGKGYNPDAPQVRNYHEFDIRFLPGKGKKVAWPFFEVDELLPVAIQQLNQCDTVAAGTQWTKEVFEANGITTPIMIVHQGVDTDVFKPSNDLIWDDYKFFTIGKFEARKGYPELIQAFIKAFPHEQDVSLHMLCHNPFLERIRSGYVDSWIQVLTRGDTRIKVIPPLKTHKDVAWFINGCDCGVFSTRAEGWGLSLLDSLSCGKPIMSTFVTAPTEYLDNSIATEIATKGLVPARDGIFFHGRGRWYEPDVDSIVAGMRHMYENKVRGNNNGRTRAKEFTWGKAAKMLVEGLEAL